MHKKTSKIRKEMPTLFLLMALGKNNRKPISKEGKLGQFIGGGVFRLAHCTKLSIWDNHDLPAIGRAHIFCFK